MSAICHGFVQNAWRKDICSNCFRLLDEHEINSVRGNNNSSSSSSSSSSNHHHGFNTNSNCSNGYSHTSNNNSNVKNNHSNPHSHSHSYSQSPQTQSSYSVCMSVKSSSASHNNNNATTTGSSGGIGTCGGGGGRYQSPTYGSTGIPRISSKYSSPSGLSSSSSSSSSSSAAAAAVAALNKGIIYINNPPEANNHNHSNNNGEFSQLHASNPCKLRSASSLEVISNALNSPHFTSPASKNSYHAGGGGNSSIVQRGMTTTTSHPSKADKETLNNNNLLTSGARSSSSSTLTLGSASDLQGGCSSKEQNNIFHLHNNHNNNSRSYNANVSSNGNALGLTHPQQPQSTSITSSSNNNHSISTKRSSWAMAGSCNTSSNGVGVGLFSQSHCNGSGNGNGMYHLHHAMASTKGTSKTAIAASGSPGVTASAAQMLSVVTNGGVEIKNQSQQSNFNSNTAKSPRCVTNSTPVTNKKNTSEKMDSTDGEVISDGRGNDVNNNSSNNNNSKQRKLNFVASVCGDTVSSGNSNNNNNMLSLSGKTMMKNSGKLTTTKGILKSMDGNGRRKLSVSFPTEVCKVIGYGGEDVNGSSSDDEEHSNEADDDDEPVPDPQDSSSVAELLESNSTTYDEKEIHRLTQKNTNFNSIKTNLMGITSIEIGPIVGCTGGKSMENSSKPLVSIGTFESRKEPLRIRKQGDSEIPVPMNTGPRRFIQKNNNIMNNYDSKTAQKVPSSKNETETVKSNESNAITADKAISIANGSNSIIKNNNYNKLPNNFSRSNDVQVNGRDMPTIVALTGNNNRPTISTIQINPEKSSPGIKVITDKLQTANNTVSESLLTKNMSGSSHKASSIAVEKPKPKPILKNSSHQSQNSNYNNSENTTSPLSNLIILTDGNKITNKRTSFLRHIITEKDKSLKVATRSTESDNLDGTSIDNKVSLEPLFSLEKDSLEPRIVKSELKVDLKLTVNNIENNTTTITTTYDELQCLRNSGNNSEFDDSLEDSGLDIKNRTEISESDEKSGSGSDSGNENDISDRGERLHAKLLGNTSASPAAKEGLFISVDDVETGKKPAKLSPDSVLFSSASEMSASGSAESIPDSCDKNSPLEAVNIVAPMKRPAPRPPQITDESLALYANQQRPMSMEEEVYDDVNFFNKSGQDENEENELEEESLYDDCTAITTPTPAPTRLITGSYNFADGVRTGLDEDAEDDHIGFQHSDGIEFIGIRKIDSESFLKQGSLPESQTKRERPSSASPKARRKVNQFFSTIGKKAGAAFSSNPASSSNRNKITSANSPSASSGSAYKRSMSTDEVSMTRTQEIYATLTPTSLKFKGLAPVLQKLSRLELTMNDKEKETEDSKEPKEKMFKKNKISTSIKKFLRFGGKDDESPSKYDFNNSSISKTDSGNLNISAPFHFPLSTASDDSSSIPSCITEENSKDSLAAPVHKQTSNNNSPPGNTNVTHSMGKPPPPPPRVHSLDLLNKAGLPLMTHGPNGTVRPARPPPPVRSNRVAPSFVSVFTNSVEGHHVTSSNTNNSTDAESNCGSNPNSQMNLTPPNKPMRKASMCGQTGSSRDLETTYNHITSLNFETLKLIASQTPAKIERKSSHLVTFSTSPLRWSQFQLANRSPMAHEIGFVFYSAVWEDEPCVLLLQETTFNGSVFQLSCVETLATFEDVVPVMFIPWETSDSVITGNGINVLVSVHPSFNVQKVSTYVKTPSVPPQKKYLALLQAINFWHQEEMDSLLVLETEHSSSHYSNTCIESELVFVHPIPRQPQNKSSISNSSNFEISMKKLLLEHESEREEQVLSENDRQVLCARVSGSSKEVEAQFKLFLQLKLFGPKLGSIDLEKIRKHRSERVAQQWLDRERAICMKEAVERTIHRNSEPISPFKKSYLEFLMMPENSAKAVLDVLVDIIV